MHFSHGTASTRSICDYWAHAAPSWAEEGWSALQIPSAHGGSGIDLMMTAKHSVGGGITQHAITAARYGDESSNAQNTASLMLHEVEVGESIGFGEAAEYAVEAIRHHDHQLREFYAGGSGQLHR